MGDRVRAPLFIQSFHFYAVFRKDWKKFLVSSPFRVAFYLLDPPGSATTKNEMEQTKVILTEEVLLFTFNVLSLLSWKCLTKISTNFWPSSCINKEVQIFEARDEFVIFTSRLQTWQIPECKCTRWRNFRIRAKIAELQHIRAFSKLNLCNYRNYM